MKCVRAAMVAVLLSLAACVADEIAISVNPNHVRPSFALKYVRSPDTPVRLHEFKVKELDSGRTVWLIRPANWESEPVKTLVLNQVVFGVVPEGFVQHFPSGNQPVELENGTIYVATAGGATEGRTEFMTTRECRKVSLTSFSRNRLDFKAESHC